MQPRRALVGGLAALVATVALSACSDGDTDDAGDPSSSGSSGSPTASSAESDSGSGGIPLDGGYVALGDSYTAAPGVPNTETTSGCFRSDANYPSLIAAELDAASFDDVSCSGASTLSLVGAQQSGGTVVPAQFDALDEDTALVTISIGGNDNSLFQTISTTCLTASQSAPNGSACRDQFTAGGTDQLADSVAQIATRVTSAVTGVHDRAPNAEVLLVGYPQPVPKDGGCAALPLSPDDAAYVRGVITSLDDALEQAAADADATYIDVLTASKGHDVCAGDDAWVQGVQTDLNAAIALHPFAAEQRAVADLVLEQLQG